MKYKNKAFTLPELIVVITILSTLATIGFISYQGHASNTRDSKRKSDVNHVVQQVELVKIKGEDIFTFVDNSISTIEDNIYISGHTGGILELGDYIAGDTNLINLELPSDGFSDPTTGDLYKIGVTSFGKKYEVAASTENDNSYSIYTAGTWLPRTIIETTVENDKIIGKTYYMSGSTKNDILLEINDTVKIGSSSTSYIIKKIYIDRILLDKNILPAGDNSLSLYYNETDHLIKNWNTDFAIVENSGSLYSPYNLEQ